MKRLFVSAAVLPLAYAVSAQAETKITTAVTAPVSTATAASGQPDSVTVESTGSIKPTASGAAITLNSNHAVKNSGTLGFNNVDNAVGIRIEGGRTASVTNSGTISLLEDFTPEDTDKDGDADGNFAKGTGRFGILLSGPGAFTGDIRHESAGIIAVEGSDSGGIRLDSQLVGNLVSAGRVEVLGERSVGVRAANVTGDVRVLGVVAATGEGSSAVVLGDVGGQVQLQNAITASGYRSASRLSDAARAKLDADDLRQGGPAVHIGGSVGKGVLLDRPPQDSSSTDNDEDKDGVTDSSEGVAGVASYGASPALLIGGASQAITVGQVGTGEDAFGLVNRGTILGDGVNDGVASTALQIGAAGGGLATVSGGINNQGGAIRALGYGAENSGGATAVLINANGQVPALRNSGTIEAGLTGGPQNARAIVDLSGTLASVENTGVIRAATAPKAGSTQVGQAIALDLRANTSGAVIRQTKPSGATTDPQILGDILLGAGADRLEVLGGVVLGRLEFGAGADTLIIDGGARAAGQIADSDGQLTIDVREGRLALANTGATQLSALTIGAKGVLGVTVDPANNQASQLNVSGAANIASGAKVEVALASLLRESKSYDLIRAGSLTGGATNLTLEGAPFMYSGALRTNGNAVVLDLRPKSASELGLNRSGAAAYDAVFAALDKDAAVRSAMLAQTSEAGFDAVYDQLLPDHSGGALMSAHAISSAISQAVSRPLARKTDAYTGVWAQEIMFHLDRDRDQAQGFKSQGFGVALGAEAIGEFNAAGFSASFVTTDYKDQGAAAGERISMNFAEAGIYWRTQVGGLQAAARAGLGYVMFDSERRVSTDAVSLEAQAEWNGWLADLHAGLSYEAQFGAFYARPELSVSYLRLDEEGYQESGGGGMGLTVGERQGDLLTGEALLAFGARFGEDMAWGPEVKLGWRSKLSGDPGRTTAAFSGGADFVLQPEDVAAGGAIARIGFSGESTQVAYSIDAGGVFDDGYREYDVRAVIRFLF